MGGVRDELDRSCRGGRAVLPIPQRLRSRRCHRRYPSTLPLGKNRRPNRGERWRPCPFGDGQARTLNAALRQRRAEGCVCVVSVPHAVRRSARTWREPRPGHRPPDREDHLSLHNGHTPPDRHLIMEHPHGCVRRAGKVGWPPQWRGRRRPRNERSLPATPPNSSSSHRRNAWVTSQPGDDPLSGTPPVAHCSSAHARSTSSGGCCGAPVRPTRRFVLRWSTRRTSCRSVCR